MGNKTDRDKSAVPDLLTLDDLEMSDFPSFGPFHQDPLHKTLEKCKNAMYSAISGNVSEKTDKDKKDKKQPIY